MTRRRLLVALALALVAAVFLVYAPVAHHEWIAYDDDVYLLDNPHVAKGLDWAEIRWVFTHPLAGNYHPLTWVAHMLDVQLFGLEPRGHHLVNVGLHALNAMLVLALLAALLESAWGAGIGAALFALHPLRVESVAWAAERKDVLCAALFLGALLLYLRYGRSPSTGRYVLACLALVLALLAKPMAVTLPLIALLLDFSPLARLKAETARKLVLEKLPLVALAALGSIATLWAQSSAGATSSLGGLAFPLRALNALATLWAYVAQTFVPRALSVYYPHAVHVAPDPTRALLLPAAAGALLLAALLALAWRTRRTAPVIGVGVGLFLVTLLPVIGLVQVGTQAHADRYTYLPSIGLVVAALGLARLVAPAYARPLALAGGALAVFFAVLAHQQVGYWKDTRTLFEHALALDERNFLAQSKLGEVALAEGDEARACAAFERTLALNPNHVETLNNLALCRRANGALPEARALLQRALALAPKDSKTWLNLGAVDVDRGDLEEARSSFQTARQLSPEAPDGAYNLGVVAQLEQRFDEAERSFLEAVALDPNFADAWSYLGQVRLADGRLDAAVEAFERAAVLAPDDAYAHYNLGVARKKVGDREGAVRALQRALELEPEFTAAKSALRELEGGGK